MLTELSIKNFAIIEELSLNFQEGLTVLTGRLVQENRLSLMLSNY